MSKFVAILPPPPPTLAPCASMSELNVITPEPEPDIANVELVPPFTEDDIRSALFQFAESSIFRSDSGVKAIKFENIAMTNSFRVSSVAMVKPRNTNPSLISSTH